MIILGIDPGTVHTGYGVVESAGSRMAHIENGLVAPPRGADLSEKVRYIFDGVIRLIDTYRPDALSIEEIFVGKNSRSALVLGHARGVILLAGNIRGIMTTGYTPAVVKRCVTGNGAATKEQVQEMVRMLLRLPAVAQEDASDALALAICHAMRAGAPNQGLRR